MKNKIYTHDEAHRIIELFEDILIENDIKVPSPEDGDRETDDEVGLYGSVYSDLLDNVENILIEVLIKAQNSAIIPYEFSGTY